ncbi:MFS transporter [Nonomuraea longicatena]|uniref:MFS transporter n=1 Tax=Nonomuraea longicatena TaxID=83682 RepID=A0ABN1NM53_9ACTN
MTVTAVPARGPGARQGVQQRQGSGAHRRLATARTGVLVVLGCGTMALVMGDTMAGTLVVPLLAADPLGAGVPLVDLQWVASASAIAYAALLVTAGRLADLAGRRRVLLFGLLAFALGGATTIMATDLPLLFAGRAVQGAGAGAMVPASLALLLAHLPAERRAPAIGAWSAASGLGGILLHGGGGFLAEAWGWRLPFAPAAVGGAVLVLVALSAPADPRTRRLPGERRSPDPVGTLALLGGLAGLVLALTKGQQWGWTSPALLGLAAFALFLLVLSVSRSVRHPVPAVDLGLWRRPSFALAGLIALMYGVVSLSLLATAPFLLRQWGLPMPLVGLALAPLSVGVLVSSLVAGPIVRRRGARPVIYLGVLVVAASAVWILHSGLRAEPYLELWFAACTIMGLGLGAISTGASAAAALSAGTERYASAVGASMTARQIGGAVGVATGILLIQHPPLGGPVPGHASTFAFMVAGVVVAGVLALFIAPPPKRRPAATVVTAMPLAAPVPDPPQQPQPLLHAILASAGDLVVTIDTLLGTQPGTAADKEKTHAR